MSVVVGVDVSVDGQGMCENKIKRAKEVRPFLSFCFCSKCTLSCPQDERYAHTASKDTPSGTVTCKRQITTSDWLYSRYKAVAWLFLRGQTNDETEVPDWSSHGDTHHLNLY